LQTRPLNHPLDDQPSECERGIRSADHREGIDRGSLFRHDSLSPETGMASAHGVKSRNRRRQPALSCFRGQSNAVADACPVEGGDQGAVVELITPDNLPGLTAGMIPFRGALLGLKDVELAVGSVSGRLSLAGKPVRWRPHYRAA